MPKSRKHPHVDTPEYERMVLDMYLNPKPKAESIRHRLIDFKVDEHYTLGRFWNRLRALRFVGYTNDGEEVWKPVTLTGGAYCQLINPHTRRYRYLYDPSGGYATSIRRACRSFRHLPTQHHSGLTWRQITSDCLP